MEEQASGRKYPQSSLTAFEQGARLDLRLRLAIDILKAPSFTPVMEGAVKNANPLAGDSMPKVVAAVALDIACALLEDGERRGLVENMPDGSDLNGPEKKQAERNGKFNAHSQLAGQKYATQEMNAAVQVPTHRPLQS